MRASSVLCKRNPAPYPLRGGTPADGGARDASQGFHPTLQKHLQEELQRQANTSEKGICILGTLCVADRKQAMK